MGNHLGIYFSMSKEYLHLTPWDHSQAALIKKAAKFKRKLPKKLRNKFRKLSAALIFPFGIETSYRRRICDKIIDDDDYSEIIGKEGKEFKLKGDWY